MAAGSTAARRARRFCASARASGLSHGGPAESRALASPANMSKRGLSARHSVPNQTLSIVNIRLPKDNLTAGSPGRTGGYGGGSGFHWPPEGAPPAPVGGPLRDSRCAGSSASPCRNDGGDSAQHTIVIPAKAGIQYAAASRFNHYCLWNTGSPGPSAQLRTGRAMTTECAFAISRRHLPEVCLEFPALSIRRAQGRPGKTACAPHPRSRVLLAHRKMHTSIQVRRKPSRPSLRNGFTAYFVLPGERLFCLRRSPDAFATFELNASTTAPEPHDFTVRVRRATSLGPSASIASHCTLVTMADAPHLAVRRVELCR